MGGCCFVPDDDEDEEGKEGGREGGRRRERAQATVSVCPLLQAAMKGEREYC